MEIVVTILVYFLIGSIVLYVVGEDDEPAYSTFCFLFWPLVLTLFMFAGIISIFYRKW